MNGRAFMLTRMNGAPTVDENDDVDCDAQAGRYRKSYVMEAEAALYMDLPPSNGPISSTRNVSDEQQTNVTVV